MRLPVVLPAAAAAAAEPVRRRCRRATSGSWGEQRVDLVWGGMHAAGGACSAVLGCWQGFTQILVGAWMDGRPQDAHAPMHWSGVACTLKHSSAAAGLHTETQLCCGWPAH